MTKFLRYKNLNKSNKDLYYKSGNVLTIGFFDGVHIGHQKILGTGKKISLEKNIPFVILTFQPHPNKVFSPAKEFPLLTSLEDRLKLINNFDVDLVIVMPFTKDFSVITKGEFLDKIIKKKINPKLLVIGEDFRFGYKAKGNVDFLKRYFEEQNIKVNVIQLLKINKKTVSSTLIRELIKKGEIFKANNLLQRNYEIYGSIIKGRGMGKVIGFPTINIKMVEELVLPGNGVYLGEIKSNILRKYCLINIGKRPTFNGKKKTIEFYILNTEKEKVIRLIKSEILRLCFIDKLRNEIKFESVEKLVKQIKEDIKKAKGILIKYRKFKNPS